MTLSKALKKQNIESKADQEEEELVKTLTDKRRRMTKKFTMNFHPNFVNALNVHSEYKKK